MADQVAVVDVPVEEVAAPTIADITPENLNDAIRIVIRAALEANGLVLGLSEVARALDRRTAHMCFLAGDCEDEEYKKLVTALATQGNIDFIEVESREDLAQWAGLVRKDASGEVKKIFKCSCVAINNFGERTKAFDMITSELSK